LLIVLVVVLGHGSMLAGASAEEEASGFLDLKATIKPQADELQLSS
jgi:hypothetical protein